MDRTLRIEPLGRTVAVQEGHTLLEAALAEGRVRYRVEWPGLSPDEKAEGFTLPCVALPETDVVLLQPRVELTG
jgi:ferredoxin